MRARSHSEPLAPLVLDLLLESKIGTILVPTFFKGLIFWPRFASPANPQRGLKSTSDLASPWASVKTPIQHPNGYPFGGPDEAPDRSPNGGPDGSPNGGADESPNGDQIGAQMDAELEASRGLYGDHMEDEMHPDNGRD